MRYKMGLVTLLVVLTTITTSSAKGWRGLIPLKSTRIEVERLLGPSDGVPARYILPDEVVYVQYSKCTCQQKCQHNQWNVPPDRVTHISIQLKKPIRVEESGIDLSNYKKIQGDFDVIGHFYYVDAKEGFSIEVGQGYVGGYIYGPRSAQSKLRCTPPAAKQSSKRKEIQKKQ